MIENDKKLKTIKRFKLINQQYNNIISTTINYYINFFIALFSIEISVNDVYMLDIMSAMLVIALGTVKL